MAKAKKRQSGEGSKRLAQEYTANIKVVGVGGGGGNAVSRMRESFGVRGVEFIAINTDAQDLDYCDVRKKIYIGKNLTRGLGTGMNPELGRQAAEENRSEIVEAIRGADLVFITAGLGGGTGSGAAPVVAEAAKELGILTVSVVTKPFTFEGIQRTRIADEAAGKLQEKSDTLIIVPNDRIFEVIHKDTPLNRAFEYIDEVLRQSVQGIAELISMPGIINVDFADVKAIIENAGTALVGIGIASGQNRATTAVEQAVKSPLLEISIDGARGVLFAVSGGRDMKMTEVNEIARAISGAVDSAAKIIFGAYHDRKLAKGQIKVVVIATGFGATVKPDDSNLFAFQSARPAAPSIAAAEPVLPKEEPNGEMKKESKDKKSEGKKKSAEDIWDIPTFLRKKRK